MKLTSAPGGRIAGSDCDGRRIFGCGHPDVIETGFKQHSPGVSTELRLNNEIWTLGVSLIVKTERKPGPASGQSADDDRHRVTKVPTGLQDPPTLLERQNGTFDMFERV